MNGIGQSLERIREQLRLSPEFVERETGLRVGQLRSIELEAAPVETVVVGELCDLYGVDPGEIASGRADAVLDAVRLLPMGDPAAVSEKVRTEISRVAAARRDLRAIEEDLGGADRHRELRLRFRHEGAYGDAGSEWAVGKDLAHRLREDLGLVGGAPIPSVRDLIEGLGIELVAVGLSSPRVAGFSLADPLHGPAIVINLRGANANPWVRRFTICHELCHVLHDELTHRELAPVQTYDEAAPHEDPTVGPEPRANAFAAHLLAPDDGVRNYLLSVKDHEPGPERQVRALMRHFGINFKAARYRMLHAQWARSAEFDGLPRVSSRPAADDPVVAAEAIREFDFFPCPSVPHERRGWLARRVVQGWVQGVLDRHEALEILRAAPDEPLELLAETAGA